MKADQMGEACGMYGVEKYTYRVLVGKREEMNHLEDVVVDGRIILKCILRVQDGMICIGLICLCRGANGEL